MDIRLFVQTPAGLDPNLFPEIQQRMDNDSCNAGKTQSITHREGNREEQGRVSSVFFDVESQVVIQDRCNVVGFASIIEGTVL